MFLLLVHYFPYLPGLTSFVTGKGSNKRSVDIGRACEALGPDKSATLLGFHAFSGCDQTSKFCGKSKLGCWKAFTASSDITIEPFQRLGESEDDLHDSVINGLTQCVNQYCGYLAKTSVTLAEDRWLLYSKFQDSDKLPPTSASLMFKILRT